MSELWRRTLIDWKKPTSWTPTLSKWLRPHLNERGIRYLQRMGEQDLFHDDLEWLDPITQSVLDTDIDEVADSLADALSLSRVRAYHGCRTVDAGSYHREGIRLNNPKELLGELRQLIAKEDGLAFLRSNIEPRIVEADDNWPDTGRLFLCLDDRVQIERDGQYLLYGSEGLHAILDLNERSAFLRLGSPTIILVHLPLSMVSSETRRELASTLLQEWAHIKVNKRKWVPKRDFTFILRVAVPAEMIVGHEHPACVKDPYHQIQRRNDRLDCVFCRDRQS